MNKKVPTALAILVFVAAGIAAFMLIRFVLIHFRIIDLSPDRPVPASIFGAVFAQQAATDIEVLETTEPNKARAYNAIELKGAWDAARGEAVQSVHVGVVDTGVDPNHREFRDVQLSSFGNYPLGDPSYFLECANRDFRGHGTAVNGIIGAGNLVDNPAVYQPGEMNGVLSGVLREDQYVLEERPIVLNITPGTVPATIFDARFWTDSAVRAGASVINLSFGTTSQAFAPRYRCALDVAEFEKISAQWQKLFERMLVEFPNSLFVVTAGNRDIGSAGHTPSNVVLRNFDLLRNVFVVGGVDSPSVTSGYSERWSSSNYGPGVHIGAPAAGVYTPKPDGGYNNNFGGTSASAPFVTGVAGLLKALEPAYQQATPGFTVTPQLIKDTLVRSADVLTTTDGAETGKTLGQTGGAGGCNYFNVANARGCRLNAHRAVVWWLPPTPVTSLTATVQ